MTRNELTAALSDYAWQHCKTIADLPDWMRTHLAYEVAAALYRHRTLDDIATGEDRQRRFGRWLCSTGLPRFRRVYSRAERRLQRQRSRLRDRLADLDALLSPA